MTLNPFGLLEKAINEHGSAVILKERLALAKDQFVALERKLAEKDILLSEKDPLLAEKSITISQLQTENQNLRLHVKQLERERDNLTNRLQPTDQPLTSEQEKILGLLASNDSLNAETTANALGISKQAANYHLNELHKHGLIDSFDSYLSTGWNLNQNGRKLLHSKGLLA